MIHPKKSKVKDFKMTKAIINPLGGVGRENRETGNYQIFVLRMWSEDGHDPGNLRLSIEDTYTSQRKGFTDWENMLLYLREKMNA